jgi:hypothetical protein
MVTCLAIVCLVAMWSCEPLGVKAPSRMPFLKKIAVMPFYWISSGGGIARNPLTGAVFASGPHRVTAAAQLTEDWFRLLLKERTGFHYVSPLTTGRVMGGLRRTDLKDFNRRTFVQVGRSVNADAVLIGFVYRWRERVGSGFGVDSPASVGFDALLVRTTDSAILWSGRFEQTQQALSENLLRIDLYATQGVRWVTARELASFGLSRMIAGFPKAK